MKKKISVCMFLAVSIQMFFLGCVTSRETMIKEIANYRIPVDIEDKKDMGLVYVVRPSSLGTLIRFNVFINNPKDPAMEAGWTRGSQYIYFFITPGIYNIYSDAENTAEITIQIEKNKIYYIKQTPQMGIIMARNQLSTLDEVEGKYYLKDCKVGEIKRKEFK